MFEAVVTGFVNKFLGEYISNLEKQQLNIAIWNGTVILVRRIGDVKLKNLKLRKDALDKFKLPINVYEGCVEELILKIPWQNLKSQSVKVFINGVYLLVGSKEENKYDENEAKEREYRLKMQMLEEFEMISLLQQKSQTEEEKKRNESFVSQLITKIVDNVQVVIKDIHVRYEDRISNPKKPFSCGINLTEISAVSTNERFEEIFVENIAQVVYKLLKMDCFSVYWENEYVGISGDDVSTMIEEFKR
ncbi:hypothetical protein ROZALSC1DRAFT_29853, partial [Rozella allomycis CSF55]